MAGLRGQGTGRYQPAYGGGMSLLQAPAFTPGVVDHKVLRARSDSFTGDSLWVHRMIQAICYRCDSERLVFRP